MSIKKYVCFTGSMDSITNELNIICKYSNNIKSFSKIVGMDQFQRPIISIIIKIYFINEEKMNEYENKKNNNHNGKDIIT
jgi:hypothetical protein